jgi:folylpolyglutamate synthase/dihydropteroate synthase
VTALRETVKNLLPGKKIILLCGMLKDKEPEKLIEIIAGEDFVTEMYAVPVDSPRAETPENLYEMMNKHKGSNCNTCAWFHDLYEAFSTAAEHAEKDKNTAVICFGSLYLAGEIKRA